MFDIGWTELLLIGIVALIVIGPKDLPGMFHALGRFTARARSMARDFTRAMEDAARESGVDGVAKDLRNVANPRKFGMDKLNEAAGSFEKWDPLKGSKPTDEKKLGPNTSKLSKERAEKAEKIRENAARIANERIEREKAEAAAGASDGGNEAPKPAKKPTGTSASKTTAKSAAGKKPASKAKSTGSAKSRAAPTKKAAPKKADG